MKRLSTPAVLVKPENRANVHLWSGPNRKKEGDFDRSLVQIRKRRVTSIEVFVNLKKGSQLRSKFGPNQKKEGDFDRSLAQIAKSWSTTPVVVLKM
jgi:hypothetical protein